jgi:hypothetical protein
MKKSKLASKIAPGSSSSATPEKKKPKNPRGSLFSVLSSHFWRWLSLAQIALIFSSIFLAIVFYNSSLNFLEVAQPPIHGDQGWEDAVEDAEIISYGEGWVNLLSTYHYMNARSQFEKAHSMALGDYAKAFQSDMQSIELTAIEQSKRIQNVEFDGEPDLYRQEPGDPPPGVDPDADTKDWEPAKEYRHFLTFFGSGTKQINDRVFDIELQWDLEIAYGAPGSNNPYGMYVVNASREENKVG